MSKKFVALSLMLSITAAEAGFSVPQSPTSQVVPQGSRFPSTPPTGDSLQAKQEALVVQSSLKDQRTYSWAEADAMIEMGFIPVFDKGYEEKAEKLYKAAEANPGESSKLMSERAPISRFIRANELPDKMGSALRNIYKVGGVVLAARILGKPLGGLVDFAGNLVGDVLRIGTFGIVRLPKSGLGSIFSSIGEIAKVPELAIKFGANIASQVVKTGTFGIVNIPAQLLTNVGMGYLLWQTIDQLLPVKRVAPAANKIELAEDGIGLPEGRNKEAYAQCAMAARSNIEGALTDGATAKLFRAAGIDPEKLLSSKRMLPMLYPNEMNVEFGGKNLTFPVKVAGNRIEVRPSRQQHLMAELSGFRGKLNILDPEQPEPRITRDGGEFQLNVPFVMIGDKCELTFLKDSIKQLASQLGGGELRFEQRRDGGRWLNDSTWDCDLLQKHLKESKLFSVRGLKVSDVSCQRRRNRSGATQFTDMSVEFEASANANPSSINLGDRCESAASTFSSLAAATRGSRLGLISGDILSKEKEARRPSAERYIAISGRNNKPAANWENVEGAVLSDAHNKELEFLADSLARMAPIGLEVKAVCNGGHLEVQFGDLAPSAPAAAPQGTSSGNGG